MQRKASWALVTGASVLVLLSFKSADPISVPDDLIQGFRLVEVASVADAMEQLYGKSVHVP